tara:strand:- start:457 stop:1017 length:561 start_codon:yes stop_codon:yes gene_type:complete
MKIEAFPTSIYILHNNNNNEIKSIVEEYYRKNKSKSSTPDTWNCQLFTTFGTKNFPNDSLQKLTHLFNQFQRESQMYGNMTFTDLWLNCYETINWQEKHMHLPSKWSGVYYAIFDEEEHSPTHFYNPNEKLIASNHPSAMNSLAPKVKEGDMVIFPSWLDHAAPLNKSSKLRATISFNFFFDNEPT